MIHSPVINQNVRRVYLGVREFSTNNILRAMTKGFLLKAAFQTPMDSFLAAFHCLGKLYALAVEGVSLEEGEYMAVLSAPTLKRLRIRNVSLKGPQPLVLRPLEAILLNPVSSGSAPPSEEGLTTQSSSTFASGTSLSSPSIPSSDHLLPNNSTTRAIG